MMKYKYIKKVILPEILVKGRKLEYYLIQNLFKDNESEIISELIKYQNLDGGFGNALEPDIRMPSSSVAATNTAINILGEVENVDLKRPVIEKIVKYFERTYIEEFKAWEIVPKEVNGSPRAVWWNYETINSFTYGNPNPEVIGFLYQNKELLNEIDIDYHVDKVVNYVNNEFESTVSMHSLLSVLRFYNRVNNKIKALIRNKLIKIITIELDISRKLWDEYSLEPISIYGIEKYLPIKKELLEENLIYNLRKLEKGIIMPLWQWYQYEGIFEKIKYEWSGLLTYNILKVLISNKMIQK